MIRTAHHSNMRSQGDQGVQKGNTPKLATHLIPPVVLTDNQAQGWALAVLPGEHCRHSRVERGSGFRARPFRHRTRPALVATGAWPAPVPTSSSAEEIWSSSATQVRR